MKWLITAAWILLSVSIPMAAQKVRDKSMAEESCMSELSPLLTGFTKGTLAPGQTLPINVMFELNNLMRAAEFVQELSWEKGWENKIPDSPSAGELETCRGIVAGLYPRETVVLLSNDGSVFATRTEDGFIYIREFKLPNAARSSIALESVRQTLEYAQRDSSGSNPKSLIAAMIPEGRTLWFRLRDTFCFFHPAIAYTDLFNNSEKCARTARQPDESEMMDDFGRAETFRSNYVMWATEEMAERLGPKAMQELADDTKKVLKH